jgi:quercetin dioxygenase-like cupin family protein
MCKSLNLFTAREGKAKCKKIKRNGSQPSIKGAAEYFAGSVRIDSLFAPMEPSRVSGGLVTFESGARSAWHTHPLEQNLIVVAGCGWTQCEGDPKK